MVCLNLFYIMAITVFIVDLSGFVTSVKKLVSWLLTGGKLVKTDFRLKPLDCDFCMTWWSGLIYLICIGEVTFFHLYFLLFLCCLAVPFKNLIQLIIDAINTLISKLGKGL